MSLSPTAVSPGYSEEYTSGWVAIFKMLREGGSWSGRERNCCFLNTGGFPFADISAVSGLDYADDGRGLAVVDWDRDGALDLWTSNRTGPRVRFLRNTKTTNHFVAVRLVGRNCNRDAIGARLVLFLPGERPCRLTRTLHAGDAYLSQSSKWIHFGLGESSDIERLVVHWPGGSTEEFRGLEPDRRYRIAQGARAPEPCPTPAYAGPLTPSQPNVSPVTEQARIVLAARMPLPTLTFVTQGGQRLSVTQRSGYPILINLWSNTCPPCIAELNDFVEHQERLRATGLRIIALNVDPPAQRRKAESTLKRLSWPFVSGIAPPELLDILDILQRGVLNRHRQLPLPSSFLLDGQSRLAFIYKGPISAGDLLTDVALTRAGPDEIRAAAAPLGGRWQGQRRPAEILPLVQAYIEQGYTEVANEILAQLTLEDNLAAGSAAAKGLAGAQTRLGHALFAQDRHQEAIAAFRRAARIDGRLGSVFYDVGMTLAAREQYAEAITYFLEAVRAEPQRAEVHENLGLTYYYLGQVEQAAHHYEEALRLQPDRINAAYNLSGVLEKLGSTDKAISVLRQAVQRTPGSFEAWNYLGLLLHRTGNLDEAIGAYRAAMALKPRDPTLCYNLGLACVATGDRKGAITQYEALKSLNAERANVLLSKIRKAGRE